MTAINPWSQGGLVIHRDNWLKDDSWFILHIHFSIFAQLGQI